MTVTNVTLVSNPGLRPPPGAIRLCEEYGFRSHLVVMEARVAKFSLGQLVKHRIFPFRGVIFDVDPEFNNTEAWMNAIPENVRPRRDQPFYHLLAENDQSCYTAYVSEQNLLPDDSGEPIGHPEAGTIFSSFSDGGYRLRPNAAH